MNSREKKLLAMRQWYITNRDKILEKYHLVTKCVTCDICQRVIKSHNMRFHLETRYHKRRVEFLEEQRLLEEIPTLSEFFKYRTIKCHTKLYQPEISEAGATRLCASLNTDDTPLANNLSLAT